MSSWTRSGHRALRTIAVTGLAAVSLSSCLLVPALREDPGRSTPSVTAVKTPRATTSATDARRQPPSDNPGLARFYQQVLDWQRCAAAECATLLVPIDYADPAGDTIELALLRMKATGNNRIGSLVVNPGGPGGSGVEYASYASVIVGPSVRQRFDVVGFDPRGVGQSAPVDCIDDVALDQFLGSDPTPDDDPERQAFVQQAKGFAQGCLSRSPKLLAHVSTREAARDMDILRAALDEEQLHYLGKSYGTYLGTVYAGLFPSKVGRFVLDGVVAPDLTSSQLGEGQGRGFELATRTYLQDCVDQGSCPLGESVDDGIQAIQDLLAQLDAQPIPVKIDRRVTQLTEGWATIGIAAAMYQKGYWPELTDALDQAQRGSGDGLMKLAYKYARRTPLGSYDGNIMEVIYAVNCLDRPDTADLAQVGANEKAFAATAPTWGRATAWGAVACGVWPIPATNTPAKITAQGANPIVVVGTTRDPATIYEWAVRLRDQLAKAVLITYDGDGHTAYKDSTRCVDDPIDAWYVNATLPTDGLRC